MELGEKGESREAEKQRGREAEKQRGRDLMMGKWKRNTMLYLYLDESGDLGFDFVTKNPSRYFVVTILAIDGQQDNRRVINGVKKTLKRKLNRKKKDNPVEELKGYVSNLETKKYFLNQIEAASFKLFVITLDKKAVVRQLTMRKERLYNHLARKVLDVIPFENLNNKMIELIVDKSKPAPEIREFNTYIRAQVEGRINPKIPLNIYHLDSKESKGLQACDMFCWGIFHKYERNKKEWYNLFRGKIVSEGVYLP